MERYIKTEKQKIIYDYIMIIIGVTLLAISINVFFEPNDVVTGGVTGLGIIIKALTTKIFGHGLEISITNIIFNVPLFIMAYKYIGKNFFGRTVFATFYLSVALVYTSPIPKYVGDMTLVAVYGGILMGAGLGFVIRAFATTGGTELFAVIVHNFIKSISISQLIFIVDALVILFGFFIFGAEKTMYGIITIFICTKCIKSIVEGMHFAKTAVIISDKSKEIADAILNDVDRGVTSLYGKGMYTGESKEILLCVFNQKEITAIKAIVNKIDNKAFIILMDSKEVLGEGFQSM